MCTALTNWSTLGMSGSSMCEAHSLRGTLSFSLHDCSPYYYNTQRMGLQVRAVWCLGLACRHSPHASLQQLNGMAWCTPHVGRRTCQHGDSMPPMPQSMKYMLSEHGHRPLVPPPKKKKIWYTVAATPIDARHVLAHGEFTHSRYKVPTHIGPD